MTTSPATLPVSAIEAYLTLGFVPSARRASDYLDALLGPVESTTPDAPTLLTRILEERTYSRGHREIVIPLTGGTDSRSLLGAALAIFNAGAIRCITVGAESFHECIEAANSCRRVGVRHERIESATLVWNIDKLTTMARERFEATGSCVTLETLVAFGAINDRFAEMPIVSGFLGDAASGKHLPTERGRLSRKPVEASFIAQNRSVLDGSQSEAFRSLFRSFAADNAWRLKPLPGATEYDLLDLGFRQSHYIRPNSDAFSICIRPFEDPRWVFHWLSRPLNDRIRQLAYVREMRQTFSKVFGDQGKSKKRSLARIVRPLVPVPLLTAWRTWRHGQLLVGVNRGDPRTNASMAATVRDLLGAFDRRRLLPFPTLPVLEKMMARGPDSRSFQIVRWASSAEIHIRAGNIAV